MSTKIPKPDYNNGENRNTFCTDILTEYRQCLDEGLMVEKYGEIFQGVSKLENSEIKSHFCDVLFEAVCDAELNPDFKYREPSDIAEIELLRKGHTFAENELTDEILTEKIHGAWMGRICGCLLGKPVECIKRRELVNLLKTSGNYPMRRYILSTDITDELCEKTDFNLRDKCYADTVDGMPVDDDTNYVTIAQLVIEKYGKDFTPCDVASVWLKHQPQNAYFTAEKVAYLNLTDGFKPPYSAIYKNPYREWIGAQIRGDYFGYINPGNPEKAAQMAYRDATVSHIKNGIYGEMWASAMISCAAVTNSIEDIIRGGLAQIPSTSRLYEAITSVMDGKNSGVTFDECCEKIHTLFDENTGHGWCHTIPNAMIVAAALLYGEGDFGKSICMAVQCAFDTDCNGATVGSVLGMRNGISGIDDVWTAPVNNTLHTSVLGVGTAKITDLVKKTLAHINLKE